MGTFSNMSTEDQILDEKFQKFHQRLMKSSSPKFQSNIFNRNIQYAEVKEIFHPPEHLLPMIPEESSIEIEYLAAAALSSIEAFLPQDYAIVKHLPFLPFKMKRNLSKYHFCRKEIQTISNNIQPEKIHFSVDQSFGNSHQVISITISSAMSCLHHSHDFNINLDISGLNLESYY